MSTRNVYPHVQNTPLKNSIHRIHLCFVFGLLLVVAGCTGGAARLKQVSMNASKAGKQAMEQYDTNGDGYVDGAELENAPGLRATLKNLDTDEDGQVSADEVADRVRAWQGFRSGIVTFGCNVTLDGKPLSGAQVVLEPESFLGDSIETARGTTGNYGQVSVKIPKENRPTPDTPPGLRMGIYLVKITKQVQGKEIIPPKYNTETTLGQEVSPDDPMTKSQRTIEFKLTTK